MADEKRAERKPPETAEQQQATPRPERGGRYRAEAGGKLKQVEPATAARGAE